MSKTLLFIQADMHRAINEGRSRLEVSVLDMKELLGEVMRAQARDEKEKLGIVFGFIRKDQLGNMRKGAELYCSIRRKRNEEYCEPVYCDPLAKTDVDATAQIENTDATTQD